MQPLKKWMPKRRGEILQGELIGINDKFGIIRQSNEEVRIDKSMIENCNVGDIIRIIHKPRIIIKGEKHG